MAKVWSQDDNGRTLDDFWRGRRSSCPTCGTTLRVTKHPSLGTYVLFARCPRCAVEEQIPKAEDPYLAEFGKWSDDDKAYMADAALDERPVKCTTCDTPLKPEVRPEGPGKTLVRLMCGRCGNSMSEEYPKS